MSAATREAFWRGAQWGLGRAVSFIPDSDDDYVRDQINAEIDVVIAEVKKYVQEEN